MTAGDVGGSGHVIDGRLYARDLKSQLAAEVSALRSRGARPGLGTLLVGEDYPALTYERRVQRLADELGCHYVCEALPTDASEPDAVAAVGKLDADPRISGILVLRPLPGHISEVALYRALDPLKDIEAVNPVNAGLMALARPRYIPSTPASCFYMLDRYLASTGRDPADFYRGATIVVVGRSANVGKPAILLGLARHATVISCDEHTHRAGRLQDHTAAADVLIVAAGVPGLVTGEHVKPGVIAIDVGINAVTGDDGRPRLVGDLDYASVAAKAEAVSPVPGGVGPVTDVWLLRNTIAAADLAAHTEAAQPSRDGYALPANLAEQRQAGTAGKPQAS